MNPDRTTLYLRGVPRDLVREAKATAARRGCTLAVVVSDALAREIRAQDDDASQDDFEASMRWYAKQRARLVRKYAGEFIAVLHEKVLDHDTSFEALAARVFAARPDRPVFMPLVVKEHRVVRVPSPRRVR